jgi:hypothetical protein
MITRGTVQAAIEGLKFQCSLLGPAQPEVRDGKPTDQDCFNQVVANTLFQILSALDLIEATLLRSPRCTESETFACGDTLCLARSLEKCELRVYTLGAYS